MPDNNYPPYANDTGALVLPRTLQRWLDVNPQGGALRRCQTYLSYANFSVPSLSEVGETNICYALNFSAPNNFSLKPFTSPVISNYTLCVAYAYNNGGNNAVTGKVSNKVIRYILWQFPSFAGGTGNNIPGSPPLYNGQPLMKNCRFEVWSDLPLNDIVNQSDNGPAQFLTSVLQNIDYRYGVDAELTPATPITGFQIYPNGGGNYVFPLGSTIQASVPIN